MKSSLKGYVPSLSKASKSRVEIPKEVNPIVITRDDEISSTLKPNGN